MAFFISYSLIQQQDQQNQRQFTLDILQSSELLARELGYPEVFNNSDTIKQVLLRHREASYLSTAIVTDNDNRKVAVLGQPVSSDNPKYVSTRNVIKNMEAVDERFANARTLRIFGSLQSYYSTEHLDQLYQESVRKAGWITFLATLFAILISLILHQSIYNAFSRFSQMIRSISQGRLSTRITETSAGDVGVLESEINEMANQLQNSLHELQQKLRHTEVELQESRQQIVNQIHLLQDAENESQQAVRIKTDFMANMSHEIRTPMNGILGFANLLLKSNLTHEQHEYVQTIRTSATNLLAIINDILDFSKLESGELTIEKTDINLREVIEDVINFMSPSAHDKDLELLLMFYSDVPEFIHSDAVRIRQVTSHLIANAIKFTKIGQIVVRVMLEEETVNGYEIKISVQDTGIGLSLEDQDKLFTAFNQADTTTTRQFGGAGLGLVISKGISRQMHGSIGLDSQLTIGSTFWFQFPCEIQHGRLPIQQQAALKGTRALVYDRNQTACMAVSHHLQSWDIDYVETNHADDVAKLINHARNLSQPFQYIILSLANDEIHNGSIEQILRDIIDENHYAFVMLVNSTSRDYFNSCYRQGADICLPKTVRKKDFYQSLCNLLADHFNLAISMPSDKREISITPYDLSGLKILVVDDNRINRKLVTTLLRQSLVEVHEATTGKEAVELVQTRSFDLIFMDIHMPVMNGIEATEKIRSIEHGGHRIPIIAVTANAVRGERERLTRHGLDGCLIKPVTEQDLWSMIVKWVEPTKIKPIQYRKISPPSIQKSQGISYTQHALKNVESEKALEYAGGNNDLAKELYAMFIDDLPKMKTKLVEAYQHNDRIRLEEVTHKIHGAASCCAIKSIKEAAGILENAVIRNKKDNLHDEYGILLDTIDELLGSSEVIS